VTCVRPPGQPPVVIRDAAVAADYVASLASHYQDEISRPWPDVVEDVRQEVQAVINDDGAFITSGDLVAFMCPLGRNCCPRGSAVESTRRRAAGGISAGRSCGAEGRTTDRHRTRESSNWKSSGRLPGKWKSSGGTYMIFRGVACVRVNSRHPSGENISTGPSRFFESRTATTVSR
jgi:hypothetical protein